jgi:tetratricopeptide (TPR) repeat protein
LLAYRQYLHKRKYFSTTIVARVTDITLLRARQLIERPISATQEKLKYIADPLVAKPENTLRKMSAHEFVRRLNERVDEPDYHYTFWLGAGCSVSSGIPAAAALVKDDWLPRLHRVKAGPGLPSEDWIRSVFTGYDSERPGSLYGPVMNELFPNRDERQRETERLCGSCGPGFGYAVLASLMSRPNGLFSTALTTNFDDLIADAMYVYGNRRPLVIQHEALSGFMRPGRVQRPLVVKVHGDHRLNPMHTQRETGELKKGIKEGVRGLLQDRGVIFMGYSGNDGGVIEALDSLTDGALPLGVWWVSAQEPESAIRGWLERWDATWVKAGSFDELMLLFREEFKIEHPTAKKFEQMFDDYRLTYASLSTRVEDLPEDAPDSDALKQAARKARETASDWWKVELEASRFRQSNPDLADRIYAKGIEEIEDSRLLVNYAIFLLERKENERADEIYARAIAANPEDALALGNYAAFLDSALGDSDRAEEFFERSIAADPERKYHLGNYAAFLANVRKDRVRAREFFERAIAGDPNHANTLGNYSRLLYEEGRDAEAANLVERAFANEPEPPALAELWFSLLAVGGGPGYEKALPELVRLVGEGVRSPGWNFGGILERARERHDPEIEWLERLSEVIADRETAAVLEDWPRWSAAQLRVARSTESPHPADS